MTIERSDPSRRKFRLLPEDRFLGWTPYVWLGYFPMFLAVPAAFGADRATWAATIAGGIVFLVLYFRGYWARGRELIAIIAALALLGYAFIPTNSGATVFITYAAAFAGVLRPKRVAVITLGVLAVSVLAAGALLLIPKPWWQFEIFLILMIGAANIHFTRMRQITYELRQAQEQVEQLARVAERERIARDLHDVLGHTLTLITLKSALAARLVERDPARATIEMREVELASREALQEVRSAVTGYRDVGLAREVASAGEMLSAAGVTMEEAVLPVPLTPTEEATLAMVVREAVTNVVRHAGATICRISLTDEGGTRLLSIEDDGRWKRAPDGNGLSGMRERVRALGGHLVVDMGGGAGTRVQIRLAQLT